jgi:hypothetical protein
MRLLPGEKVKRKSSQPHHAKEPFCNALVNLKE